MRLNYTHTQQTRLTVEQGKEKRYASVTIVMFTVIYAVFNIPSSLLNLVNLFNSSLLWEEMLGFDKLGYFSNFVWSLSIPLNSFCNPILYIIRMKNLREAMLTLVTGKGSRVKDDYPTARTEMVRVTVVNSPRPGSAKQDSVEC